MCQKIAESQHETYNACAMTCPLCGARKARRSCPALGQDICPVCCGTKRLVEIRCPADCGYLASSREHPAAVTRRQQEHDLSLLVDLMRDFNDRQSQLLLGLTTCLARYRPDDLQSVIDDDVAEAAAALAATFETAARGVIYDHRPTSFPAERLAARLRAVILDVAPKHGSTPFERDTAGVLRRIEGAVRDVGGLAKERGADTRRPFLDLLERVTRGRDLPPTVPPGESGERGEHDESDPRAPRLIVP